MTMNEAEFGGVDDGTEAVEEIPLDAVEAATAGVEEPIEIEIAELPARVLRPDFATARHLAVGASQSTLCGLPKTGLPTAHPSKAKKTDCQACKDVLRKKGAPTAPPVAFKAGDRVEFPDGSAWLVEDVRQGGADVRCVVAGGSNKKGARTVISPESPLRIFAVEEFDALVARLAVEAKAEREAVEGGDGGDGGPKEPKAKRAPSAKKWRPSKADVDEVRRLRAAGQSYIAIETAMNWPDGHGNRPFRIMKGAWDYETLE